MTRAEFNIFYNQVVKKLGMQFQAEHPDYEFCDNSNSLYEEYLNQKTLLRVLYRKEDRPSKSLLDRHKVCSCMTAAIIKVRLLSCKLSTDEGYELSGASRINEQLAFLSSWELFKGFLRARGQEKVGNYVLPDTFHNASFVDTITRSLFLSNQLNSLSTPLIANIFFLLEVYCNERAERLKA